MIWYFERQINTTRQGYCSKENQSYYYNKMYKTRHDILNNIRQDNVLQLLDKIRGRENYKT